MGIREKFYFNEHCPVLGLLTLKVNIGLEYEGTMYTSLHSLLEYIEVRTRKEGLSVRARRETQATVLKEVLAERLTSNEDLKKSLCSTYNKRLVYRTFDNNYWGVGVDLDGFNRLGLILEELRLSLVDVTLQKECQTEKFETHL